MKDSPTYIGEISSVVGSKLTVTLSSSISTNLIMLDGVSYRVGQVGSYFKIPLGYTSLYGVCTQVGSSAIPGQEGEISEHITDGNPDSETGVSSRWMTIVLFGESIGDTFERGVADYPTVGDEVHLVSNDDLNIIYDWHKRVAATVSVGSIASAAGIDAQINLGGLVSRHSAIVGSTGAGKSNLVAVLLNALSDAKFKNARVLVVDPHGEYGSAIHEKAQVFSIAPDQDMNQGDYEIQPLSIPYWALPFDELNKIAFGNLGGVHAEAIRDIIKEEKLKAKAHLSVIPNDEMITADSPIPFSIKKLWHDLDRFERITFQDNGLLNPEQPTVTGNPDGMVSTEYPTVGLGITRPFKNKAKRNIEKQLDFLKARILDPRYNFLLNPEGFTPDLDGKILGDLDKLVESLVGHERPISILDVSGAPSGVLQTIVGTLLRMIYDMLFWGQALEIGGKQQPLLIVVDEAHLFVPEGDKSPAHRILSTIAKEGRKYGVGIMLVSQRPSELDSAVLSQCGSFISLRITNDKDRAKVASAIPDDLGDLAGLLPSLRTGEAIFLGEVLPIPSRVRVYKAKNKPIGGDPKMPESWLKERTTDSSLYTTALTNWRSQTIKNADD